MTLTAPAGERVAYYDEGDLWRWQLEALADLTAFVQAHAPGTAQSLPAVPWWVADSRRAVADVGHLIDPATGTRRDPLAVLTAYAAALGAEVQSTDLGDHTSCRVKARIGRPEGTKRQPRTTLTLFARLYRDLE